MPARRPSNARGLVHETPSPVHSSGPLRARLSARPSRVRLLSSVEVYGYRGTGSATVWVRSVKTHGSPQAIHSTVRRPQGLDEASGKEPAAATTHMPLQSPDPACHGGHRGSLHRRSDCPAPSTSTHDPLTSHSTRRHTASRAAVSRVQCRTIDPMRTRGQCVLKIFSDEKTPPPFGNQERVDNSAILRRTCVPIERLSCALGSPSPANRPVTTAQSDRRTFCGSPGNRRGTRALSRARIALEYRTRGEPPSARNPADRTRPAENAWPGTGGNEVNKNH